MNTIGYFAIFEPAEEGGFVITFPDLPEAISEADDKSAAMFNASEVLDCPCNCIAHSTAVCA